MTPYAVTVDADVRDLRTADHLLHTLVAELALPEATFGCTHLVRETARGSSSPSPCRRSRSCVPPRSGSRPADTTSPGPPDTVGRAVLYPGAPALTGTLTIAELLSRSAIDRVTVLGAPGRPSPETRLITGDHVRPQWQNEELVLTAMPAVGGTLVPFEVADPTPCCADH